jgi:hypothetical protein
MHDMTTRRALGMLAAGCLLASSAAAEDFRWQGVVASGGAIEIKGVNGGIDATGTGGSGPVEVTAVKKARRSDPEEVEIQVVEHAGGVRATRRTTSRSRPGSALVLA